MTRFTQLLALAACCAGVASAQTPPVGVFVSETRTFSTNSFWLEGPTGLVMVDTQFLPREGAQALERAQRATGKKVELAIVLHPNPDKFNGTAELQARGIRVVTSRQVAERIAAVHAIRWGWFGREYAPDYPREAAKPEVFGATTTQLSAGGLRLTAHVLGAGASGAHVVVQADAALFVGDLVNPDHHAWLELGLIDEWLARLDELQRLKAARIYPGRGQAGGPELIARQMAYLRDVQQRVQAARPEGEISWFTKRRLAEAIRSAHPSLGYEGFMRDGLDAVWRVEAAKLSKERKAQ